MKKKLDEIANLTKAHLAIVGQQILYPTPSGSTVPNPSTGPNPSTAPNGSSAPSNSNGNGNTVTGTLKGGRLLGGLELERNVEILITGDYESVEQAKVRLLVLLDELVRFSNTLLRTRYSG